MANLQYTVFEDAAAVALGSPLQENVIAIGATSAAGDAIVGDTRRPRRVRVMCEAKAFVMWGDAPVAKSDGTDGRMMGSESPEYFDLEAGWQIAVIERT